MRDTRWAQIVLDTVVEELRPSLTRCLYDDCGRTSSLTVHKLDQDFGLSNFEERVTTNQNTLHDLEGLRGKAYSSLSKLSQMMRFMMLDSIENQKIDGSRHSSNSVS